MLKQILLLGLIAVAFAKQSYEGYKVIRTEPLNGKNAGALNKLMLSSTKIDFWKEPQPGRQADIMAGPEDIGYLYKVLDSLQILYAVYIEDVEKLIKEADTPALKSTARKDARYNLDWTSYQSLANIYQFIDEIAAMDADFESKVIGSTYDGREIKALEINRAGSGSPTVFVEAGIHAREWIANSVGTYLINQLVENYGGLNTYIDKINFAFVPMANPDGYEWTRSDDRLWRKNRSPFTGGICADKHGVDLNRNFGYHYGESGTSDNQCSDTWHGDGAFSELEAQALRDYYTEIKTARGAPEFSLCLHSYSQLFLVPYGYAQAAYPPNYQEMFDLAESANAALFAEHNTRFVVEHSSELYPAAGASDDWYKSEGSRYTYTLELRDTGTFGFILPAGQIIPSGEEVWAAFKVILDKVLADGK